MIEFANIFGETETLLSDHLYPYRYVITPLLALAGLAAAFVAYRRGVHEMLWRHRTLSAVVGVPMVLVAVVAGNYLLSPLWERSFLEEASPLEADGVAVASPSAGVLVAPAMDQASMPTMPTSGVSLPGTMTRVGLSGAFRGGDDFHFGRGDALIIQTDDGKNILRFEDFSVRNGPDLYVYLSRDESGRRVDEALNLGRLKATDGAFNYEVPAGVDLAGVRSVVVWCRQFSTLFAVAPLTPV